MAVRLRGWLKRCGVLLCGAAAVAAPFAAHAAIATGRFVSVALVLTAVQAAVVGAVALRQARGWQRTLGLVAAAVLVASLALRLREPGMAGLMAGSGLSHALIYSSLLLLFGQSLRPGSTPLVTGLALRLRGTMTPAIARYTRTVTKAWCVFFLAQLLVSATLLAIAPHRVWSLFVNVLDGPAVLGMFLCEFAVRWWRFRGETHHSPWAVARSFARGRADG